MSAAIKKMLADRARVEGGREKANRLGVKWDRIRGEAFAMIDKSAPFIDEGADQTKWKPSTLLKLTYFVASTGPYEGGEKRATLFILAMLDEARKRFIEGFHPDPFPDQPRQHEFAAPSFSGPTSGGAASG